MAYLNIFKDFLLPIVHIGPKGYTYLLVSHLYQPSSIINLCRTEREDGIFLNIFTVFLLPIVHIGPKGYTYLLIWQLHQTFSIINCITIFMVSMCKSQSNFNCKQEKGPKYTYMIYLHYTWVAFSKIKISSLLFADASEISWNSCSNISGISWNYWKF